MTFTWAINIWWRCRSVLLVLGVTRRMCLLLFLLSRSDEKWALVYLTCKEDLQKAPLTRHVDMTAPNPKRSLQDFNTTLAFLWNGPAGKAFASFAHCCFTAQRGCFFGQPTIHHQTYLPVSLTRDSHTSLKIPKITLWTRRKSEDGLHEKTFYQIKQPYLLHFEMWCQDWNFFADRKENRCPFLGWSQADLWWMFCESKRDWGK